MFDSTLAYTLVSMIVLYIYAYLFLSSYYWFYSSLCILHTVLTFLPIQVVLVLYVDSGQGLDPCMCYSDVHVIHVVVYSLCLENNSSLIS